MTSGNLFVAALVAIVLAGCGQPASQEPTATEASDTAPVAAPASDAPRGDVTPAAGGAAVATGGQCGTIAGLKCASGDAFCKTPPGQCGVADAAGICTTKPEVCTEQYDPVCGCDGKTYGNACTADAAGANIASRGECKPG